VVPTVRNQVLFVFLLLAHDRRRILHFNVTANPTAAWTAQQVVTPPRSPWQNASVERLIGTIRRECLDHVIVVDERHLRRILSAYFRYYHEWRTHQALEMDCPEGRKVQAVDRGRVVQIPEIGGLHHHYERIAA